MTPQCASIADCDGAVHKYNFNLDVQQARSVW